MAISQGLYRALPSVSLDLSQPLSVSCLRYLMPWTPISIKDEPRYPWRGLLIDSARHYLSVPLLEKTIDSMAALKLNTLHWHLVDAESFPFVSSKYPGRSTSLASQP
jgi:hypothetical protein